MSDDDEVLRLIDTELERTKGRYESSLKRFWWEFRQKAIDRGIGIAHEVAHRQIKEIREAYVASIPQEVPDRSPERKRHTWAAVDGRGHIFSTYSFAADDPVASHHAVQFVTRDFRPTDRLQYIPHDNVHLGSRLVDMRV